MRQVFYKLKYPAKVGLLLSAHLNIPILNIISILRKNYYLIFCSYEIFSTFEW